MVIVRSSRIQSLEIINKVIHRRPVSYFSNSYENTEVNASCHAELKSDETSPQLRDTGLHDTSKHSQESLIVSQGNPHRQPKQYSEVH